MKIIQLFQSFQTQEQALAHLEKVRWKNGVECPYCHSKEVGRHASADRAQQRWQCRACTRAFAVTVGTIFHGTHMRLQDWFIVLALMLNAKKSLSAYQVFRDTGIRRATAWRMMQRIRMVMDSDEDQRKLLHGIVEMDETYVGGKPRKTNKKVDRSKKRGNTSKIRVIGAVERNGHVIAEVSDFARALSAKGLMDFVRRFVDPAGTLLITDEHPSYGRMKRIINHAQINHQVQYADGETHTNTIESFWALVKRAHYGSHHHYSRKYMPLYIAEASYKFNQRKVNDSFDRTLALMVGA